MSGNPYETEELLQQYLVFHYAAAAEQFPYESGPVEALDFPLRCALKGFDYSGLLREGRALDLGCAVGRSSFELARHFREVIGIDFSQAFIDSANTLRENGSIEALRHEEGSATKRLELMVDPLVERERVSFEQGDAQDIREDIGQFDAVMACNLICRLPEPMRLLRRLPELVKPGGQLFMTTPFTWLEEYTPSEKWLCTGADDSFTGLREALEPEFQLLDEWDMPFLIREHARKYQYSIAQASRWQRV